jgi:hypothetical protein
VKDEYEDIIKGEVQRAISADEEAIKRLCANYIENVRAYTQHEKVKNKYTGKDEEPDERLMRSIEEKIDIPESRKDDFRQEIMNYIGALALEGRKFEYNTNARLYKALELKLFEDQRDTIKLKNLVSSVVDDETQAKIDVVKQRLIKQFGYNEQSRPMCSTTWRASSHGATPRSPDSAGGHADHGRAIRDVASHDGSRPHRGLRADTDPGQYPCPKPDERPIPDVHTPAQRCAGSDMNAASQHHVVFDDRAGVDDRSRPDPGRGVHDRAGSHEDACFHVSRSAHRCAGMHDHRTRATPSECLVHHASA